MIDANTKSLIIFLEPRDVVVRTTTTRMELESENIIEKWTPTKLNEDSLSNFNEIISIFKKSFEVGIVITSPQVQIDFDITSLKKK